MPEPKLVESDENATFLKLYCACLSGVASQLEQMDSLDGLPLRDIFSEDLKQRESFAVKRAFRLARLASQELEIDQFNKEVSEKL